MQMQKYRCTVERLSSQQKSMYKRIVQRIKIRKTSRSLFWTGEFMAKGQEGGIFQNRTKTLL